MTEEKNRGKKQWENNMIYSGHYVTSLGCQYTAQALTGWNANCSCQKSKRFQSSLKSVDFIYPKWGNVLSQKNCHFGRFPRIDELGIFTMF